MDLPAGLGFGWPLASHQWCVVLCLSVLQAPDLLRFGEMEPVDSVYLDCDPGGDVLFCPGTPVSRGLRWPAGDDLLCLPGCWLGAGLAAAALACTCIQRCLCGT